MGSRLRPALALAEDGLVVANPPLPTLTLNGMTALLSSEGPEASPDPLCSG